MSGNAFEGVGELLRELRTARRWTQEELADRSGSGASRRTIIGVEGGNPPSTAFIKAVSAALEIDPVVLLSPGSQQTAPLLRKVEAVLPEIRRVLATYDCPPDLPGPPRGLAVIAKDVQHASALRLGAKYGELAEMIIPLIDELSFVAHSATGRTREEAFGRLAAAYRCVDALVYKSGHPEISPEAVERIKWAADKSADPLMVATATYVRAQGFFDLPATATAQGLHVITRAAEPLETAVSTDARTASVYGSLHARAAVLAAKGGMLHEADGHLAVAREAAGLIGRDTTVYGTFFGVAQWRIIEIATYVEMGNGAAAVRAAEGWMPEAGTPDERSSHALIDLARAFTWEAQYARAFDCLIRARRIAPQHTRMHPLVAPTFEQVRDRSRRRLEKAAEFAAWLGLPPR